MDIIAINMPSNCHEPNRIHVPAMVINVYSTYEIVYISRPFRNLERKKSIRGTPLESTRRIVPFLISVETDPMKTIIRAKKAFVELLMN